MQPIEFCAYRKTFERPLRDDGIESGPTAWARRSGLSVGRAAPPAMQDARPCAAMPTKLAGSAGYLVSAWPPGSF